MPSFSLFKLISRLKIRQIPSAFTFCTFFNKSISELSDKLKPLPTVLPKPAKYVIVRHCFKLKTVDEKWNSLHEYKHFKPQDTPLSKRGLEQAEILSELMKYQNFNRIISSPYRRCVETLLPVSRRFDLKICLEPGFSETQKSLDHVDGFENIDVLKKDYNLAVFDDDYAPLANHADLQTVESKIQSQERAKKTLDKVLNKYRNDCILICTHSTACGALMKYFCDETVYFRFGAISFLYETQPGKFSYTMLNTLEDEPNIS